MIWEMAATMLCTISSSFPGLIHQYGTKAQASSRIWQPTTPSIITPATALLLWALLICRGRGPAVSSTRRSGMRGGAVLYRVHPRRYDSLCFNRAKARRGQLDLKQDGGRGKGRRKEGGYPPKLWKNNYLQRSLRRAKMHLLGAPGLSSQ